MRTYIGTQQQKILLPIVLKKRIKSLFRQQLNMLVSLLVGSSNFLLSLAFSFTMTSWWHWMALDGTFNGSSKLFVESSQILKHLYVS
jgi:hypothetical protein